MAHRVTKFSCMTTFPYLWTSTWSLISLPASHTSFIMQLNSSVHRAYVLSSWYLICCIISVCVRLLVKVVQIIVFVCTRTHVQYNLKVNKVYLMNSSVAGSPMERLALTEEQALAQQWGQKARELAWFWRRWRSGWLSWTTGVAASPPLDWWPLIQETDQQIWGLIFSTPPRVDGPRCNDISVHGVNPSPTAVANVGSGRGAGDIGTEGRKQRFWEGDSPKHSEKGIVLWPN